MSNLIDRQLAIDAVVGCTNCKTEDELRAYVIKHSLENGWTGGIVDALDAVERLPSAQPDNQVNLCDSCDYSYPDCPSKNDDVIFGSGIGNDNICACNKYKPSAQTEITLESAIDYLHKIGWMQEHDRILTESTQPEIKKEYNLKKIYNIYVKIAQAHFVYQPSKPKTITAMPFDWIETQNLLEKYLEDHGADFDALYREYVSENAKDGHLPSAQPEPDWDYSEETKQITLIVPEDVYDSAETIFLSVGYEGTFGIRGMVYSVQPSFSCAHENDSISRRAAIDAADMTDYIGLAVEDVKKVTDEVVKELKKLPSAQPEIKPIEYRDCANAMLKMWIDNVVTDGEYNRIMDKLNAHWGDGEWMI